MSQPIVRLEREGEVALAILNDPVRLNPLTIDLQKALREVLAQVRGDRSVRALVLTGEGKAFCAGADLSSMSPAAGDERSLGERTADMMEQLTNRIVTDLQELPVPVVSAVNGPAAGAGAGLALAADVVVAARSSYFYLPFIPKLGIVPDMGCTWFLERRIGHARAMALTLLGDRLTGEQAAHWGLAWACVDDAALRQEALALARRLARLPAHGVIEARRAYAAAGANDLPAQLNYERDRQRELIDRPEFTEGVRAFLEKREPVFPRR